MDNFKHNILSIYGTRAQNWLNQLPQIIKRYCLEWELHDLTPVTSLTHNYVLTGSQNHQAVILKIGIDNQEIEREYLALKHFANFGAIQIIAKADHALLLRKADPGYSLKDCMDNISTVERLQICCRLMQKLHGASTTTHFKSKCKSFVSISQSLTILNKNWNISNYYLNKARELKTKLLKIKYPQIILHGDLHHDNILRDKDTWVIIDPKGRVGYPINEVSAFIIDPIEDSQYIANFFGYELQQVQEWHFVQLILKACWCLEDNISPKEFLDLAHQTYNIIC